MPDIVKSYDGIQRSASLLDKYEILGANYVTKTKDNLMPIGLAYFTNKSKCIPARTTTDLIPIVGENV